MAAVSCHLTGDCSDAVVRRAGALRTIEDPRTSDAVRVRGRRRSSHEKRHHRGRPARRIPHDERERADLVGVADARQALLVHADSERRVGRVVRRVLGLHDRGGRLERRFLLLDPRGVGDHLGRPRRVLHAGFATSDRVHRRRRAGAARHGHEERDERSADGHPHGGSFPFPKGFLRSTTVRSTLAMHSIAQIQKPRQGGLTPVNEWRRMRLIPARMRLGKGEGDPMGTKKNPRRSKGRIHRLVSNAIAVMVSSGESRGHQRFAWRAKERGRTVTGVNAAADADQVNRALAAVGLEFIEVEAWQAPTRAQLRRRRLDADRRAAAKALGPVPTAPAPAPTAVPAPSAGEAYEGGADRLDAHADDETAADAPA